MLDYRKEFPAKSILVIGDLCLDRFVVGDRVSGSSREGGIETVRYVEGNPSHRFRYSPGGGGNLACNFRSLGAGVSVAGVIGGHNDVRRDYHGDILIQEFAARAINTSHLIRSPRRTTITFEKGYDVANQTTPLSPRYDFENSAALSEEEESRLIQFLGKQAQGYDAVVAIDHCEVGDETAVLSYGVLEALANLRGKGIKVFGSSRNRIALFTNQYCLVPNANEAVRATSHLRPDFDEEIPDELVASSAERLYRDCNPEVIVLTESASGASYYNGSVMRRIPTIPLTENIDICGCGDTFLAALVLAEVSGAEFPEAIKIANAAAGTTAKKLGTTGSPTLQELEEALK